MLILTRNVRTVVIIDNRLRLLITKIEGDEVSFVLSNIPRKGVEVHTYAATMKTGQTQLLIIGVKMTILGMNGRNQARLGFDAEPHIQIHRAEVQQRIDAGVPHPKAVQK